MITEYELRQPRKVSIFERADELLGPGLKPDGSKVVTAVKTLRQEYHFGLAECKRITDQILERRMKNYLLGLVGTVHGESNLRVILAAVIEQAFKPR